MNSRPRIAVLASGNGSNLQALIDAHQRGDLSAPVVVVISNNSGARALKRARTHQIPIYHISSKTDANPDERMLQRLQEHRADIVVLAGYMKRVSAALLARFPQRIVNVHPAPLPRFGGQGMYGSKVHSAVLAAKVSESGPTVHLVDAEYDRGAILAHRSVEIKRDDTPESLAERVLTAEHDLLWRTVEERFCRPFKTA